MDSFCKYCTRQPDETLQVNQQGLLQRASKTSNQMANLKCFDVSMLAMQSVQSIRMQDNNFNAPFMFEDDQENDGQCTKRI